MLNPLTARHNILTTYSDMTRKFQASRPVQKLDCVTPDLTFDPNPWICRIIRKPISNATRRYFYFHNILILQGVISYFVHVGIINILRKFQYLFSEAIQPDHLKVVVASHLHMYYTCTNFDRNLRCASIFCVDLALNYPCVTWFIWPVIWVFASPSTKT